MKLVNLTKNIHVKHEHISVFRRSKPSREHFHPPLLHRAPQINKRVVIENPIFVCARICHSLYGPFHPLCIVVQFVDENLLSWFQCVHRVRYGWKVPKANRIDRRYISSAVFGGRSICGVVGFDIVKLGGRFRCGWKLWPFFPSCTYSKEPVRPKISPLITSSHWGYTGHSTFPTGYTVISPTTSSITSHSWPGCYKLRYTQTSFISTTPG